MPKDTKEQRRIVGVFGVICVEVENAPFQFFLATSGCVLHAANSAKEKIHQNYLAASLFV